MDKDEKQLNNISSTDLPTKNEEATSKVPLENTMDMPTIKSTVEDNNSTKDLNMTLPTLNIANSESVDDNKKQIQANSVLDNKADFQSIFHVESEELPEAKKAMKQSEDKIAPVVETKKEEFKALPEEKAQTESEKKEKKNIRKDNFNGEDKIIYEIKEEKEGNPIVVLLFFVTFITVILVLPFVSKTVKFNNGTPVISGNGGDEEQQTDEFYYFDRSSVRAKIGNLEFTNFVKHQYGNNKYTLTFNISNKQQKAYTFDGKYYVIFYRDDLIVHRALIYSPTAIGANAITSIEININEYSYTQSNRFKLEEILPSSYPKVTLSETDGEYRVLTCTYNNDEMRYYFIDNQLQKVKEKYVEKIENNSSFSSSYEKYYNLSKKYKEIENFSSTFVSQSSEFSMINEFDYKNIPDTVINNLNEYKFFRYNESKDTINFEMEALSYNCG